MGLAQEVSFSHLTHRYSKASANASTHGCVLRCVESSCDSWFVIVTQKKWGNVFEKKILAIKILGTIFFTRSVRSCFSTVIYVLNFLVDSQERQRHLETLGSPRSNKVAGLFNLGWSMGRKDDPILFGHVELAKAVPICWFVCKTKHVS